MKKSLILALCTAIICFGCARNPNDVRAIEPSIESMRLAVILPSSRSGGYWGRIRDGFIQGVDGIDVDITFFYPHTRFDIPQMTSLIRRATASKVDAIAVQGIDDLEYIQALQEAHDQGILIGFVDTDIDDFPNRLYVGTDNYAAGVFMANQLVAKTGGKATIAVIMAESGFPNLDERLRGATDVIANHRDMEILRVEYSQFDTLTVIEKYHAIIQDELIDTIILLDGSSTGAFGRLSVQSEGNIKIIIGFDIGDSSADAIRNGVIQGTVAQQPSEMGLIASQELYRRFTEGCNDSVIIYTDVFYVTASNLEDFHQ